VPLGTDVVVSGLMKTKPRCSSTNLTNPNNLVVCGHDGRLRRHEHVLFHGRGYRCAPRLATRRTDHQHVPFDLAVAFDANGNVTLPTAQLTAAARGVRRWWVRALTAASVYAVPPDLDDQLDFDRGGNFA
jgi:hypothetical protein